jgi:ubiquinone/menaquinone biosynthesis C-methylase UbiE/uncharacterized protein YbaR (Trm112 family)
MKNDLLEILACPNCPGASLDLKIFNHENSEITLGELSCSNCKETYPIQEGIPRMVPRPQEIFVEKKNQNLEHYEVREANITYYDSVADVYEDEVEQTIHQCDFNQRRIDEMVKGLAEKTQKQLFLDLGCGTGNVLKFGKKYFKRAIGVDISFNMLKQAQKNGLEVIQGDTLFLPFKSSLFDVVSIFSVLHHIYDYSLVLNQISRVLKSGGYLYSDWDPTKKPSPSGRKFSWAMYQLVHTLFSKMEGAKEKIKFLFKDDNSRNAPVNFVKMRPDLKETNAKAEYHNITEVEKRGIDFLKVKNQLELQGFCDIEPFYHQSGLTINQLKGVPLIKSRLLAFLGFDPEPFLENILILATKKGERESGKSIIVFLEKCEKK